MSNGGKATLGCQEAMKIPKAFPPMTASFSAFSRALRLRVLTFSFLAVGLVLVTRAQSYSSIDPVFSIGVPISPNALALDMNGKLLCAGGNFVETVNGHAQRGIVRLNADGSVDFTFDAGSGFNVGNSVNAIYPQPDGTVIVVGSFTTYNAVAVQNAIRLFSDGRIDPTYQVNLPIGRTTPASGTTVADSQGRLYVATYAQIVRLDSAGAVDPTFTSFIISGQIKSMDVDSNGQLLVLSDNPQVGTASDGSTVINDTLTVQRLNGDGSVDRTQTLSTVTYSLVASTQFMGNVYATKSGAFYVEWVEPAGGGTSYYPRPIVKYKADFTIDPTFSTTLSGSLVLNRVNDVVYVRNAVVSQVYTTAAAPVIGLRRLDSGSSAWLKITPSNVVVQPDGPVIAQGYGGLLRYDPNRTVSSPPQFVQAVPNDLYAATGTSFNYDPVVTGDDSLTFQWFHGTTPVTLPISNVQSSDAGTYTVSVTGPHGNVTSQPITLHVEPAAPTIITPPSSQLVQPGGIISFTIFATGASPLQYQWYQGNQAIAGATDRTYIVNPVTAESAGTYFCFVRADNGSTESAPVPLQLGSSAQLSNLSVRLNLSTGQTAIAGFVTNAPKPLLLRAAGPALNAYGLSGLPDPAIQVFDSASNLIAQNDNWDASLQPLFTALGAFDFPAGSKDAALSVTLNGVNSMLASGTGSGALLLEVYDAESTPLRRLVNLSARSQVGTGAGILIAGFVISGSGSERLLIRGVGPSLAKYNVAGVLPDPQLAIYDSKGVKIAANDNWDAGLATIFTQVGAFGLDAGSNDAALVIDLPAGIYSVQLSGVGGTTGEGLIEVYEVKTE